MSQNTTCVQHTKELRSFPKQTCDESL